MTHHAGMVCGKRCYPDRRALKAALGRYQKRWQPYWCDPCNAFHVASVSRRESGRKRTTTFHGHAVEEEKEG